MLVRIVAIVLIAAGALAAIGAGVRAWLRRVGEETSD